MPQGRCGRIDELPDRVRAILQSAARAVLSTVDRDGQPHVVPVCFALRGESIITAIDDKPKSTKRPARVKNIERTGRATLLADHYEDEWRHLGWVMVRATATVEEIDDEPAELMAKYPQYREVQVGEGLITLLPQSILWWTYS